MRHAVLILSIVFLARSLAGGQDAPATQPTVSRQEYEQLLRRQERMQQEIDRLKAERPEPTTRPATPTPESEAVTHQDLDDLEKEISRIGDQVHSALPGSEHLVIAGDAAIGFVNQQKTNSTFFAGVSPLFLWEPTDRLLFETAFDVNISTDTDNNSSTSFDLTIADASFVVNDWLIVGGGLFVVPFGQYHNHFDPPWINKLPDDPLVFSDGGIASSSEVGIFARGAVGVFESSKLTYDLYLTNGPNLIVKDPAAAGSLNFQDFTDLNNGKAVGGRIGFLPMPSLEVGYSAQFAQTAPSGFGRNVDAFLQAVDANFVREIRPIGGVLTLRAEWVFTDVSRATYDPNGKLGFGPISFGNYRHGGYFLAAYRPTLSSNAYLRNLEFVVRYDMQHVPLAAPGGEHEQRWALGVDYWVTPSAVLKLAYEIDDKKLGPDQNAFFVQFGIGL